MGRLFVLEKFYFLRFLPDYTEVSEKMGLILCADMLEEWLIFFAGSIFGEIGKIREKIGAW